MAESLSDGGKRVKHEKRGISFYEITKPQERILVCAAIGHLYSVDRKEGSTRRDFPIWDLTWKPRYLLEKNQERLRFWIEQIQQVSQEADRFVNACDYDIEGSVIGATILKYACNDADRKAKRMKFSTLTKKELQEAYANLTDELDYPLVNSGMCRHEVDWIYGVNLSRVLTESAHEHGGIYSTLSTGRVQGPTLRFVVEREREINCFVPLPYWTIDAMVEVHDTHLPAQYVKEKIDRRSEADKVVQECSGGAGTIVELESEESKIPPPAPFDLSALQGEAYRHFRMRPSHSLATAERLYLDALISYPRTSSQKLPPSIEYRKILQDLSMQEEYRDKARSILGLTKLSPHEGKKEDPAHPAIYPTGNLPSRSLESAERKIYDLIVRRFMATFGDLALRQSVKATVSIVGDIFYLVGIRTLAKGWMDLYAPYARAEDVLLPKLNVGDTVKIVNIKSTGRFTQPPPRFNPSSLLRRMEDHNIGTKATRAEIIETLYKRGYMTGERITATPLAFTVIGALKQYCQKVIDVDLTRELEEMMQEIEEGKNRRELVLIQAIDHLRSAVAELRARSPQIGEELGKTIRQDRQEQVTLISQCPRCSSKLTVVRNKKTGKRFIGCVGRWEKNCTFSLPLPQLGNLTLLKRFCPKCGFQLVQTKSRGYSPMISCSRCFSEERAPTPESTAQRSKKSESA
jgi:DNA topoisomerase-1